MRGEVYIYKNDELVSQESNIIVDGGSELLADVMMVSPSLSAYSQFSGILNVSNYTIQAASFSKDASAYINNAHGSSIITVSGRSITPIPRIYLYNTSSTSSYIPTNGLPSYPDPRDRLLELLPSSVSSLIVTYGQNLNLIPYWSSVSSVSSIGLSGAYALGCYPRNVNGVAANKDTVSLYYLSGPVSAALINALIVSGAFESSGFNQYSSMDWRGFLTKRGTNSASGMVLSSTSANISSLGEVFYTIKITSGDLGFANAYGGIFSIGLWSIDLLKSIQRGSTIPFGFSVINNPREYKLFAKKVFNKDLTYIQDNGANPGLISFTDITIVWRLRFV